MRKISLLIVFVVIGMCSMLNAQQQSPLYYLGAYAGYNHNIHWTGFGKLEGIASCCPQYEGGNGPGFSLGGLYEYLFTDKFYIAGRLGYQTLGAELVREENIGNTLVKNESNQVSEEEAFVDHYFNSTISTVGLEPTAGYRIIRGLNVTAGLRLSYIFTGSFSQREQLIRPEGAYFLDGSRLRNDEKDIGIPKLNQMQIHGVFGMGYELPLGGGMLLMPEFRYYLPVTHVSNALWKASSFQFGLALKAPIFPEKDLPVIRDTIITRDTTIIAERGATPRVELDDRDVDEITEESTDRILERTIVTEKYNKYVPKKMDLAASVRAVGISAEGERQENPTIVIEETEVSESFPVLPYVFFPEGSSELSATAMHLLKPEGTSSFVEDSLPWNTLDIYSEMLNIVGSRMKKNPDAKIVVTGCNNNTGVETKNLPLSKARAGAVKDYLVYVWGIDEERILAQQRNLPANPGNTQYTEGQVENQRAEISSRDFDIIQPVKLRDIQKTSNPPNVEIYPEITAEAGIAGWNLRVLQKEQTLREYTGESRPNMINWEVENAPIPALDTPLELNLWAADKDGQTTEATDQLEIRQLTIRKKRYELQDDKRIERFSLIVFDYDKAKLTENHKKILRKINERIQPDSKVTISGYADRTGDREYNRVLAYRRCMEVREELDITESNLKLNPVGSDILLYDNDTPQGRSYSRTVQIVVETPVR